MRGSVPYYFKIRLRQNVLSHLAPLYLMSDPTDIRVVPQVRAVHNKLPKVFFYDRCQACVGPMEGGAR